MFFRAFIVLAVTASVLALPVCSGAVPVGDRVILGFGARYSAPDGSTAVHRGADVAFAGGDEVEAPVDGTVSFVGSVPGAGGDRILAVTLLGSHGKLTLSPFDRVDVRAGAEVRAGAALGRLAPDGDPSSPESHVHVSLRVEDVYVDPVGLLAPAAPIAQPPAAEPQPVVAPESGTEPQATGEALRPAESPEPVSASGAPQLAPGVSIAAAPAVAAAPQVGPAPNLASAPLPADTQIRVAPGVDLVPSGRSAARVASAPRARRVVTRWSLRSLLVAGAAVPAALWAMLVLLGRRAVRARVLSYEPLSDRFGILLQHMRTGDTILGLTSCSGHSPSQSRSRLAQRR